MRLNLTRYLPRELAPILSEEGFAGLRAGRRIPAVLLFVDIRDSSALAESMSPDRLAIFVSAFRRRVMRAAARHGGVVDKFLGDGALILFGVPAENPTDAARALACGRMLCALVERWNEKRAFDPPVRIGIGIHRGEVFCGVVGDEDRLEFTVLGEAVNITARIEGADEDAQRAVPGLPRGGRGGRRGGGLGRGRRRAPAGDDPDGAPDGAEAGIRRPYSSALTS